MQLGHHERKRARSQAGFQEAVKLFRQAADKGNAQAQYNLGIMYKNGQGVKRDDKEAVKWFQRAADQGHAKAQSNLGVIENHHI